nr:MAG TPA: hypothetical protein [Caudoviricetes sp.]
MSLRDDNNTIYIICQRFSLTFLSAFRVERRFLFFLQNPASAHDFPRHFRKSTKMMVKGRCETWHMAIPTSSPLFQITSTRITCRR